MSWVGKTVTLQNVTVQDTNDAGSFWVGTDNDHRLLIVREKGNDNLKAMKVHKRQEVVDGVRHGGGSEPLPGEGDVRGIRAQCTMRKRLRACSCWLIA